MTGSGGEKERTAKEEGGQSPRPAPSWRPAEYEKGKDQEGKESATERVNVTMTERVNVID
jgi:hypothetical protein